MVVRIIEREQATGQELAIEDGFDLYKKLATVRRLFVEALPEYDFHPSLLHGFPS